MQHLKKKTNTFPAWMTTAKYYYYSGIFRDNFFAKVILHFHTQENATIQAYEIWDGPWEPES